VSFRQVFWAFYMPVLLASQPRVQVQ